MSTLQTVIATLLGIVTLSGVAVGAIVALRKLDPERRSIEVTAASSIDEIVVKFAAQSVEKVGLHAQVAELSVQVADLTAKVRTLEDNAATNRRWRHSATAYITELRDTLDKHGIRSPEPPPDLELDDG